MRQYETTFIIDSHLPEEQINATIEKVTQFIKSNGGNVEFVERWGKRRLAYEIARKQYGYYVYVRFETDGTIVKDLEREFKLDDSVLRFLTVLVPSVVLKEEMARSAKKSDAPEESLSDATDSRTSPEGEEATAPEKTEQKD